MTHMTNSQQVVLSSSSSSAMTWTRKAFNQASRTGKLERLATQAIRPPLDLMKRLERRQAALSQRLLDAHSEEDLDMSCHSMIFPVATSGRHYGQSLDLHRKGEYAFGITLQYQSAEYLRNMGISDNDDLNADNAKLFAKVAMDYVMLEYPGWVPTADSMLRISDTSVFVCFSFRVPVQMSRILKTRFDMLQVTVTEARRQQARKCGLKCIFIHKLIEISSSKGIAECDFPRDYVANLRDTHEIKYYIFVNVDSAVTVANAIPGTSQLELIPPTAPSALEVLHSNKVMDRTAPLGPLTTRDGNRIEMNAEVQKNVLRIEPPRQDSNVPKDASREQRKTSKRKFSTSDTLSKEAESESVQPKRRKLDRSLPSCMSNLSTPPLYLDLDKRITPGDHLPSPGGGGHVDERKNARASKRKFSSKEEESETLQSKRPKLDVDVLSYMNTSTPLYLDVNKCIPSVVTGGKSPSSIGRCRMDRYPCAYTKHPQNCYNVVRERKTKRTSISRTVSRHEHASPGVGSTSAKASTTTTTTSTGIPSAVSQLHEHASPGTTGSTSAKASATTMSPISIPSVVPQDHEDASPGTTGSTTAKASTTATKSTGNPSAVSQLHEHASPGAIGSTTAKASTTTPTSADISSAVSQPDSASDFCSRSTVELPIRALAKLSLQDSTLMVPMETKPAALVNSSTFLRSSLFFQGTSKTPDATSKKEGMKVLGPMVTFTDMLTVFRRAVNGV